MKRLSLFLVLYFCFNSVFGSQLPAKIDDYIKTGINAVHGLKFDEAEKTFNNLLADYPGNPYGYFGLAITVWGRLEFEHEQSSHKLQRLFRQRTETAIKKGKKWIKEHKKDPHGYLCLGGLYGLRARLYVNKHSWIKSYFSGKKGIKYLKKAIKLDPKLYDAYIGSGMYEYYAGTLPAVIKILSKVFFISGDPEEGIKHLKLVKDKGRINRTIAKLLLIEIYTQTGSRYAKPLKALEWAGELREEYPNHPMMDFVEIVAMYESRKYNDVISAADDFIGKIEDKKQFYKQIYLSRALVAKATAYFAKKDLENAHRFFTQAALTMADNTPNRWAVWAVVRLGQIEDIGGRRKKAVEYYQKALSYEDQWGLAEYIEPYLEKIYNEKKEFPGQLPPP